MAHYFVWAGIRDAASAFAAVASAERRTILYAFAIAVGTDHAHKNLAARWAMRRSAATVT